MKAFRIGRKPTGPWANMTPPIRATSTSDPSVKSASSADATPALSEKHLLDQDVDGCGGVDSLPAVAALSEKSADAGADCLQTSSQLKPTTCSRRPSPSGAATMPLLPPPVIADEKALEAARLLPRGRKHMTPEQYTQWAMQQQRETDMDEYPSLDQDVQLAITAKYMKLHEQIDAQGLYECPYVEYAKEMARYTTLFAMSMFALYKTWYLVSAFFLGLFWVCFGTLDKVCVNLRLHIHSTKSCLQPTMLAIGPLPRFSRLTL